MQCSGASRVAVDDYILEPSIFVGSLEINWSAAPARQLERPEKNQGGSTRCKLEHGNDGHRAPRTIVLAVWVHDALAHDLATIVHVILAGETIMTSLTACDVGFRW